MNILTATSANLILFADTNLGHRLQMQETQRHH